MENDLISEYYKIILNSKLFDKKWFVEKYEIDEILDPIMFYLKFGVDLDLDPSPHFDTSGYLNMYPDVKNRNMNPLVHYIKYGNAEGRLPKLFSFDDIEKSNLKKCIKGKKDFLFLINDANYELKQHFDINYINRFDSKTFIDDYYFKKELFNTNSIDYYYFVVPDKSFICHDLIPFDDSNMKSNLNNLDKIIPNFNEELDTTCYFKYDSHINFKGAAVLSFNYFKYIDNSFECDDFNRLMNNCSKIKVFESRDLLGEINYSYSIEERNNIKLSEITRIICDCESLQIPEEFLFCGKRESLFKRNENSFSDLRALVFRDSSFVMFDNYFYLFFRETFAYWDHLDIKKELIEWYKPDIIIELRTERFLENYSAPSWVKNREKIII